MATLTDTDPLPPPLRIFLVENHRDTLDYMQMYLEMLGHVVVGVDTMGKAVEALPGSNCDVLISDVGLPDGDGWELLRRVRDRLPPGFCAIAMSGFGMGADQLRSKEAGYRHHLLKPIDPAKLEAILQEAARELRPAA